MSILTVLTILALMLVTSGRSLPVDLLAVVPLSLLTLAIAIGVAFALGGVTVLYKRTENAFQFIQLLFVVFIAVPVDIHPILAIFPLTLGSDLLATAMTEGGGLLAFPPTTLALLGGKAVVYLVGGLAIFCVSTRVARHRGVLGDY